MRNRILSAAGAAVAIGLLVAPAMAAASSTKDHKVGICHATGSKTNPYVYINVDEHAVKAHQSHQDGRDIIGVKSAKDCPTGSSKPSPTPSASPKPGQGGAVLGSSTEPQPTKLPDTGAGLSALVGMPALGVAARAYLRSRKR
jgi:hypothetical protein